MIVMGPVVVRLRLWYAYVDESKRTMCIPVV
jgi:hypothetical protein